MAGVVTGTDGATAGVRAGVVRGGIEAEGRARVNGGVDAETAGVAAGTAGVVGATVVAGVGEGGNETEGAAEGVGRGRIEADGRTRGEATGVGLAAVVTAGVGVGLDFAAGVGLAAGAAEGATVGVGFCAPGVGLDAVAGVCTGAVATVDRGAGEVPAAFSCGFTNRLGGAFGGGVASVRNFVRARSAAEESVIAVHPLSMLTSTTRSRTRRGLGISRTSVIGGADTSSWSPRSRAGAVSLLRCQCKCTRSIGRGPRACNSS